MSDCNDEDEYQYHESPCSHDTGIADESLDGLIEMMEWAEIEGMRTLRTTREGANFTRYGELWVVPVYGGQPIHHDRHILDQEEGSSHTWNLVCSGDGDQMLVTEIAQDMFNHMSLSRGRFIYLNTLNRHLVTRNTGREVCVLLQMQFPAEGDADQALATMIGEWRSIHVAGGDAAITS